MTTSGTSRMTSHLCALRWVALLVWGAGCGGSGASLDSGKLADGHSEIADDRGGVDESLDAASDTGDVSDAIVAVDGSPSTDSLDAPSVDAADGSSVDGRDASVADAVDGASSDARDAPSADAPDGAASDRMDGAVPDRSTDAPLPPPTAVTFATIGQIHACAGIASGGVKCWGYNGDGELGLGTTSNRGDNPGEMGNALPLVDFGTTSVARAVSAGSDHSCALFDNGAVKCWGRGSGGRLGLGDGATRGDNAGEMGNALPFVDLGTGRIATGIAVADYHNCALLNGGDIKCWGNNFLKQLGLGDTMNHGDLPGQMGDALPTVSLGTGRTATAIVVGRFHSCALLDSRTVKCWGYNMYGPLGLGDTATRGDAPGEMGDALPPVNLGTGRMALGLTAGGDHSCALLDGGDIKCWGSNANGELGYGDKNSRGDGPDEMGDALPIVNLGTGRTAKVVVAGGAHTCALLDDDTVKCWGLNENGQLGLGDVLARGDVPGAMGDALPTVKLGTGRVVKSLVAGTANTCAILDNGGIKCWGGGNAGQLGTGGTLPLGDNPGEMGDDLPYVALAGTSP